MLETRAEKTTQTPLEFASQKFIRVSGKYPASATAQGAALALECQVSGFYKPQELLQVLLGSDASIIEISEAAIRAHRASGSTNAPFHMPPEEVRRMARVGFTYAQLMMHLPAEILRAVPKIRQVAYVTGPKVPNPEDRMKSLLNGLLRDSGIEPVHLRISER